MLQRFRARSASLSYHKISKYEIRNIGAEFFESADRVGTPYTSM